MTVNDVTYTYGEPYISQRLSGYNERFAFTGKERDEETGFGYFGARYMDHELTTMWLSVDPMADRYPSLSSYAYCAWNPVKLVDPDGREWDKPDDAKKAQEIREAVNGRISEISKEIQSKRDKFDRICSKMNMKPAKKDKKIANLNNDISDLEYQKSMLDDFIVGLDDLSNSDTRYSFNPSSDRFQQNTFLPVNGVVEINYQDEVHIGLANLVHETTHAIQNHRGQMKNGNLMFCEINAYSTQYAFSSDSFKYINNYYIPSSRISETWVRGVYIYVNGKQDYLYERIN